MKNTITYEESKSIVAELVRLNGEVDAYDACVEDIVPVFHFDNMVRDGYLKPTGGHGTRAIYTKRGLCNTMDYPEYAL